MDNNRAGPVPAYGQAVIGVVNPKRQHNDLFRKARLRIPSVRRPGHPISLEELADAVNAWLYKETGKIFCSSANQLGKYELGTHRWPRDPYRQALRAILRVPTDDALGFHPWRSTPRKDRDAREHAELVANTSPSSDTRPDTPFGRTLDGQALAAEPEPLAQVLPPEYGTEGWDMHRRGLITGIAAIGIAGWGSPAFAEGLRHDIARAVAEGAPAADVAEWERIAWEYGRTYLTTAPRDLLRDLAVDLAHARAYLDTITAPSDQNTMRRILAQLSAMIAQTISGLGDPSTSIRWWRTAVVAADASGDPETRLWVRGREIIHGIYDRRPLPDVLAIADEATTIGGRICSGSAVVAAGTAQALAIAGRITEATTALGRTADITASLPTTATADPHSIYCWSETRLRHTESFVLTYLRDTRRAQTAQRRAIAMYPNASMSDCAQVRLHQALTLVQRRDLSEGLRHASTVITTLPASQRRDMVLEVARHVLASVPAGQRNRPDVRELRDLLTVPVGTAST